jgi:septum formation protein
MSVTGESSLLVLASASAVRAALLRQAGLEPVLDPARVDEDALKRGMRAEQADAARIAEALAELKAQRVSARRAGDFVIGADQMLHCDGALFDKPENREQARSHLLALHGKTHELVTAVAVVRDGARLWRHTERARLTMRSFSDAFLESYLDEIGAEAIASVGAYQLEGVGAQLFSRIEGDYFSILGLPLLPLLHFLRGHGIVAE